MKTSKIKLIPVDGKDDGIAFRLSTNTATNDPETGLTLLTYWFKFRNTQLLMDVIKEKREYECIMPDGYKIKVKVSELALWDDKRVKLTLIESDES